MSLLCWIVDGLALFAGISVLTYIVPFILSNYVFVEQDLKKKYGAEWAVVTGSSSGIGRALTTKLAQQGVNVVMVALDDQLLTDVHKKMQQDFPKLKFRRVGCNLGAPDAAYMKPIVEATSDIAPNLIFNNAGFMMTGLWSDTTVQKQLMNYDCNLTCSLHITHHFANRMLDSKQKGAICFTSSPAGCMPTPMSTTYGATKAGLTEFASSLAPELYPDGIDVLVVHPSPVDTGFYSNHDHVVGAVKFFQKTATSPMVIANCFFKSVGKIVVHDQGYYSVCVRMLLKVLDVNALGWIIWKMAGTQADFKNAKRKRGGKTN
jgi:short-subunit dehydrogenase